MSCKKKGIYDDLDDIVEQVSKFNDSLGSNHRFEVDKIDKHNIIIQDERINPPVLYQIHESNSGEFSIEITNLHDKDMVVNYLIRSLNN